MPFDLKNLNPPARFYWEGGEEEWVDFRTIPNGELRRIRKETITPKVEYYNPENAGKPYRYESENVDSEKMFELIWDYQIFDWNIVDEKGKKIPCTTENKMLLLGHSESFAEWAATCLNGLMEDERKKHEGSEKN